MAETGRVGIWTQVFRLQFQHTLCAIGSFQENEQLCPSIQLLSETCDDGRVEFSDKVGRDVGAEKSEKGKSVNVVSEKWVKSTAHSFK